jgi:outer membrane lipoprotein SlyB
MLITSPSPGQTLATSPRILWAVVGALAVTTLALGATVLHLRAPSADLAVAQAATEPAVALEAVTATPQAQNSVPKVPVAPAKSAQPATKTIANKRANTTAITGQSRTDTVLASNTRPAAPVCAVCGTVEGVTPVQREQKPSGVGAVAGAALGGLVGNQVGGGDGKTVATILGVLGGGWAGHNVEKRMKQETRYQVDVRMEDGSLRRIEQATPATVGARVTVDGDTLSPASSPSPAMQQTAGVQTAF